LKDVSEKFVIREKSPSLTCLVIHPPFKNFISSVSRSHHQLFKTIAITMMELNSVTHDSDLSPSAQTLTRFLIDDDLSHLTNANRKQSAETITIYIKCVFPDAENPGEMIQIVRSKTCSASDRVGTVVSEFLSSTPDIPTQNKKYYLGYDQLLFREGTLNECGITHGKAVELYSPGKHSAAYHNEGIKFIVWSLLPLVIGIACFLFSVTSINDATPDANDYQAMFLFLGLLLMIPGSLVLILGLVLIPECSTPCYFTGVEWC
jgi:hypothetical protein